MIQEVRGKKPIFGEGVFIAPSADIIGDVSIGRQSSIWYSSVLRGDVMPIQIGEETNIQDGCTVHGTFKRAACTIGNRVSVGHNVVLHGCTVEDNCLLGMGSIIMDNSRISELTIVGAGSLVTENKNYPSGVLIMGSPAKVVRELTEEERAWLVGYADKYIEYKSWYEKEN